MTLLVRCRVNPVNHLTRMIHKSRSSHVLPDELHDVPCEMILRNRHVILLIHTIHEIRLIRMMHKKQELIRMMRKKLLLHVIHMMHRTRTNHLSGRNLPNRKIRKNLVTYELLLFRTLQSARKPT